MDFEVDLFVGKQGEKFVANQLMRNGYTIVDVSSVEKYQKTDIDMIVFKNGVKRTVEVKNDRGIAVYGNVFLELKNNNRQDGLGWLAYCEADYLVFYEQQTERAFIVLREEIINRLTENKEQIVVRKCGRETEGACMPISMVRALPSCQTLEYGNEGVELC